MKKILVVEDDLILNKTLCYNLRNSGYQVNSANTAGAAVKEAGAAHLIWSYWTSTCPMAAALTSAAELRRQILRLLLSF